MPKEDVIEKHIFKDSQKYFTDKLSRFHDFFVDYFLLIGIDEADKELDQIKMTKNPLFSMPYHKRVVGGILNSIPLINITSIVDNKVDVNCDIYYLNNNEDVQSFYFFQRVMNWKNSSLTSHQIWQIHCDNIFELNYHWL